MKSIFVLIFSICIANSSFSQNDKVNGDKIEGDKVLGDKITIYNTIYKTINIEDDRFLLFLGFQVAAFRLDTTQSKNIKEKCNYLNQLCVNGVKSKTAYLNSKTEIITTLASIYELQAKSFKEIIVSQSKDEYNKIKSIEFSENIKRLKNIDHESASVELLDFFIAKISESPKDFSNISDTVILNHVEQLIDASATRLYRTQTVSEIDKIFLLNNLIFKHVNGIKEKQIFRLNSALKENYSNCKKNLGELLLEGYKNYLAQNKKFKRKPNLVDTKAIYEFVISISDMNSLEANMKMSQMYLLERRVLECDDKDIIKGYNWSLNESRLNKIPVVTFKKNLKQLIEVSQIRDTLLNFTNHIFIKNETEVKGFNYKMKLFTEMTKGTPFNDVSFNNENTDLVFNYDIFKGYKYYDGCKIINNLAQYVTFQLFKPD